MRLLLPLFLFLTACSADQTQVSAGTIVKEKAPSAVPADSNPPSPRLRQVLSGETPLQCQSAQDCVVKDVGSCCGYNPQCVHVDQAVDPEGVKARCEQEGRVSICGFQEPQGCECVAQQCKGIFAEGIPAH